MINNIIIIGNFHSHPSAEAFLHKFLRIITPLSDSVVLISGDLPSEFTDRVKWIKTNINDNKYYFLSKLYNYILNQILVTVNMAKLFNKEGVDVVIFLAPPPVPILFSKLMRKKIVRYQGGSYSKQTFFSQGMFKKYILWIIFEKLPNEISNQIIIESKSSIKFQNLEKYKKKVILGALYVDTNLFVYEKDIKERKDIVGYVGSLSKNKGVDNLSKAIKLIGSYSNEKNVHFKIAGDGPLLSLIKELIEVKNLSNRVAFMGWINHTELSNYLNEIKLLVLPSYSEGLPNIVLEAMACGTPVLATSVGAIPDVIIDEETGFLMENNSPECIAINIIRSLNHPNLEKISENARKVINRDFSYDRALERYKKVLLRV